MINPVLAVLRADNWHSHSSKCNQTETQSNILGHTPTEIRTQKYRFPPLPVAGNTSHKPCTDTITETLNTKLKTVQVSALGTFLRTLPNSHFQNILTATVTAQPSLQLRWTESQPHHHHADRPSVTIKQALETGNSLYRRWGNCRCHPLGHVGCPPHHEDLSLASTHSHTHNGQVAQTRRHTSSHSEWSPSVGHTTKEAPSTWPQVLSREELTWWRHQT